MSDSQRKTVFSANSSHSRLSICIFPDSEKVAQSLIPLLSGDRYLLNRVHLASEMIDFVEKHKEEIDCLIFVGESSSESVLNQLSQKGTLLPVVIVEQDDKIKKKSDSEFYLYHQAEVRLSGERLELIATYIDRAIGQFLNLAPSCALSDRAIETEHSQTENPGNFLLLQQRRLAEKLKERLGYLGVYYKRNPQNFYRNLPQEKKEDFFQELTQKYRAIILVYFSNETQTNQLIDDLVNDAFFADLSISQILEMHMQLMDEFAQQLKLEGRNEEILLDYRLTLIDIIAHLSEMYRRSIPREDLPLEVLFRID